MEGPKRAPSSPPDTPVPMNVDLEWNFLPKKRFA
jgi:hypothetical protein